MAAGALGLALCAALVHAGWNLLLARDPDPQAAAAVALPGAAIMFAPVALVAGGVGRAALPYAAGSAALHLTYFSLLAAAYRRAELSLVYPLSRGIAPVLVLAAGALALGGAVSPAAAAGVLAVGVGVVLVRGPGEPRGDPASGGGSRHLSISLAIAGCIAAYTVVDREGMRHADPLAYLELILVPAAIAYPLAIGRLRGAGALRAALGPSALAAGIGMYGAYALVLAALRLAPAAPVAAVRETSVVIATALAAAFLGERVGAARLGGATLVAAGVALIAVG